MTATAGTAATEARRAIVVLGMGGTIAGRAAVAADVVGYRAGVVPVAALLEGVPLPAGWRTEGEQVANVDSKDMGVPLWRDLLAAAYRHLQRSDVGALVVTHGTDTLEETAWVLQAVLQPERPVVLVGAMRPASALAPDGPGNLADALTLAADAAQRGIGGVWVTLAGRVFDARTVRKVHPMRLDAFAGGDAGPAAWVEAGRVRWLTAAMPAASADAARAARIDTVLAASVWPRVEWIHSHGGADGALVRALLQQRRAALAGGDADPPLAGLVVAGTGNGSLHTALTEALAQAAREGVAVRVTTRCAEGVVVGEGGRGGNIWPVTDLPPAKARIALALELLWRAAGVPVSPAGPGRRAE
ncbi:asparaginase [Tepidimonas taiwanensis]|uniref:Putative L-asparaginase n=1 Tax=Tepidimonas taiwanensis TaxID=307486 RepID=A0A554XBD2_9BURK|nr:asparaginase [Tepidimonas taiwanensis]TSE33147.1 putative L-asparaginase [Tepidimonas taiwanensis]UBQ05948.1 asparaginase [Tepidimonas taiwanensis]